MIYHLSNGKQISAKGEYAFGKIGEEPWVLVEDTAGRKWRIQIRHIVVLEGD